MKNGNMGRRRVGGAVLALTLVMALGWGASLAQAQTAVIRYRPLTPQDLKNAGLTNTIQKSGGSPNTGIGQPVYMEALVSTQTVVIAGGVTSKYTTVVTSVNWSVVAAPPGSTAIALPGPLSNAIPTSDGGDRAGLFVAGRAVLTLDRQSYYDFGSGSIVDFKVRTDIVTTNRTLSYTNSAYGSFYLGQKHYLCVLCHADKQTNYDMTAHATAFKRKISGEEGFFSASCISCHTIGYDTTAGATNGGFDDIATQLGWTFPSTLTPTNWTGMASNLQLKANIQCENCHGPASTHMTSLGNTNAIDISLSAGTCGQCHDSMSNHSKNFEWGGSLHSTGYVFRFSGSCMPCHSAKGFIAIRDPSYSASNPPRSTEQEGITCAACHDPHEMGMGGKQLRVITTATLSNGVVITEAQAGSGVLCINCHHSRQEAKTRVEGTSSIDPHYGTQGDLMAGENGYEYGLSMPSSRHMLAVTNSCVGCHMQLIEDTSFSNATSKVGGHTFKISWEGPTNEVDVTEVCAKCHVENTFDIVAEDYDRDGIVTGVQTEVKGLLDQLALLLPPAGTGVAYAASYTPAERKGFWNYMFILEDKSLGVHNPKYAAAILQASIDDLRGGIDIDKDGLLDAWEMLKFGNLTSQSGSGDADRDGLSNLSEQSLGTNPNSADSDGDTYSDLAEVQAGTDPLSVISFPSTNTVLVVQSAYELGYLPPVAGVTQTFQAVTVMDDGGGWTNIGSPFISSNALSYQLISIRDSTQKYFRVIKP